MRRGVCGDRYPASPKTPLADPAPAPIRTAALFAAVRWYMRPAAPLGTMGGFDTGAVYVLSRDPDIQRLIVGYRERFGVA